MDNYYTVVNDKLQNLKKELNTSNNINNSYNFLNNNLLNNLNIKYDELDIEYQNDVNNINNRSRIIEINENEFEYNNKIILLLQYFIVYIFFLILLLFGSFIKLYNFFYIKYIALLISILFVIYCHYIYNKKLNVLGDINRRNFAEEHNTFSNLLKNILPSFIIKKKCTKTC